MKATQTICTRLRTKPQRGKSSRGTCTKRHGWPISLLLLLLLCAPTAIYAHIGSPNVFFEGKAGPYPVHVVIQPAEVIPGLAEVSVRVDATGIQRVTALPIRWNAGRKGAPPPDVAHLVPGETNLYSVQLWFMAGGAQSVEVEITGSRGTGRATIPVDAVARRVLGMPKALGAGLAVLGFFLISFVISIIGAAVRESVLPPGSEPPSRRRWGARGAMAGAAVLLFLFLRFGSHWWDAEASDYFNRRLYHPLTAVAETRFENGQRILKLQITDAKFDAGPPLVPDHGKLMHLFLVREAGLDAFAHLHPIKRDRRTFASLLGDLPAGSYRAYADITLETGSSDTITALADIPGATIDQGVTRTWTDPDDSWRIATNVTDTAQAADCLLLENYVMSWRGPARIEANEQISLRFDVHDRSGQSAHLEPYLGMRGHLALRNQDGSVFIHLHPGGTASMAAMQLSVLRTEGKLPLQAAWGSNDPICQLPVPGAAEQAWLNGFSSAERGVSFPYAFPKPGRYRLWVQVKIAGEIQTGVFDVNVQKSNKT